MDGNGGIGDRDRELAGAYVAWLWRAVLLAVVVLAVLRGWYELALISLGASAGPSLGRILSKVLQDRKATSVVAVAVAVICAGLASTGFAGLLPPLEYRGVGLWGPLLALLGSLLLSPLGASLARLSLSGERGKDSEKFRMMLELYPHPDGGAWDGERMELATEGEVPREVFRDLLTGRDEVLGTLGLDPDRAAALARAMDFPVELWYRRLGWWQEVYADWKRGEDVSLRLQEWDCVTPERAAERLGLSVEEVMEMAAVGELEARKGPEGEWQVRENGVFRAELEKQGKHVAVSALPPVPRSARPGRTGSGNYHDRFGKPF